MCAPKRKLEAGVKSFFGLFFAGDPTASYQLT